MNTCRRTAARRGGILCVVCILLLFASSANALTRGGLSGQWQDWGDGVWDYMYYNGTNCEFWRFKSNGNIRFAYKCGPGQWWNYSQINTAAPWSSIGVGGVGNDFLGDDHLNHNVNNGWCYQYWADQDCAYWIEGSGYETRFAYKFAAGQWWDYTSQWGHLGLGNLTASADFIGDGGLHLFDTANLYRDGGVWVGNYLGYTADAYFQYTGSEYIWQCAGVNRYKFVYGAGYTGNWYYGMGGSTWYSMTYSGDWENPDARYHGGGIFIESGLAWDPGTNRPGSVPSPRRIEYDVWYVGGGSWDYETGWFIGNPGSDNKWSGGSLNVLWCNTDHYDGDSSSWIRDFNPGYAEYTIEDVVVFLADFEYNPIGFNTMVDWMTLVRDFFRSNIRTTMVCAHGNSTGWQMGQWMSTSNYTSFYTDWQRWGTLMTSDAQIVSIHCQSGQATSMLNAIASWSGCDIYANTNTTWTYWWWITTPYEINTSIWNQNMRDVYWGDIEGGAQNGSDRWFEYTTTGYQDYRWLCYY